ncbi:heterokaryon incompatibility protein-domain-containing protein, partial [Leptodontidium sp. 2 PMI_412]
WIRNCMKGHADCHQPSYTALPSRLVDVGSADSQKLKLVETRGIEGTYFTLSHCWGGNQPLKTTKATLRERMGGIKWESLPKTFQDAVTITRKLRMQYIWIDSLCIVQDDADDWETEAANMGAIYEASLLTISASIASNPNHGIFSHRLQPNKICGGPKSDIPLLTRAWAYQERLLATRVLHYLPDELFWECRSAIRCECGVYRNQAEPSRLAIEPWRWTVIELKMWPQIVAEYSARDLTFRKDRLPALSGVARQLHTSNPSMQYLAGLWLDHLPEALLWQGPLGSRDSQPGAQTPSWSWTSLEG